MHLTNYAIQKKSEAFVHNENENQEDGAHKRSLTAVLEHFRQNEKHFSVEDMMTSIEDIAVKAAIAAQPALAHAFRACQPDDVENSVCFQILGLDIMIDSNLKPWLIEVNHLSSFGTDSPLDKKIKQDLIQDTFQLLNLSVKRKKK